MKRRALQSRAARGSLFGLSLALALATSAGAATTPGTRGAAARKDSVLVRVGNEVITPGTLQRRLEELPEPYRANYQTPEGRQQLLDRMVEERVWMITARKKGLVDRIDIKRQLEQQSRDLVIRTYINELMAAGTQPSDSEAKTYYNEHQADYKTLATATVSHIQVKTEVEARRMRQWARSGQDWKKLVQRYSTDSLTRASGGALGTVTHEGVFPSIGTQPAIAESAFALGVGAIGGPIKTTRGWHVIKVDNVTPGGVRPFEQLRQSILRQMSSQRSNDYYKQQLNAAKAALGVRADSTAIKAYLNQKKTAREMFKDAQEAGPAATRVEAYRRLLREYPESDVAPQAQFMIGFINSEELKDYPAAEREFRALLTRYPKSELAPSAQWMVDHMRSEEAPSFMNLEADSTQRGAPGKGAKGTNRKP